jgi:hypothetical protein
MHASTPHSHRNPGGQVSITDQPDACSLPADVFDENTMAGSVEHNNRKVLDVAIKSSSDGFQILRNRSIQIQCSTAGRSRGT